jgi:putative molybdopterin biosynthesis protein
MIKEMLSAKELAEYLDLNVKQVYMLLKRQKIPGTKITGKALFPKKLIDEWIIGSARESVDFPAQQSSILSSPDSQAVIAGSNDMALELLVKIASIQYPNYSFPISNMGSLSGLIALKSGNCHIAACHLLDPETGEYNNAYIKKHFSDLKIIVMNLTHREQGLIVKKGNPLKIGALKHIANRKVAFINRQEGSGTRVLLDYRLKGDEIDPENILGYSRIAYTHMEVALEIFGGSADAGLGILSAARSLNLDFIPLAIERFDLIIPAASLSSASVKALRGVLISEEFKSKIAQMGGYDTRDTGRIVYEKD